MSELENLLRQCRRALKTGGLLWANEYIGPDRFESSALLTDIITKVRAVLPRGTAQTFLRLTILFRRMAS